jgi:hypothetical protein
MECVKCGEPGEFYPRRKVCKKCIRIYIKARLKSNPEKKHRNQNARKARHAALIAELKSKTPCHDCKRQLPYWVMEFDHVSNKSFQISKKHRTKGIERLMVELSKCDLVCSVCHRHRTFCRMNGIELYVLS